MIGNRYNKGPYAFHMFGQLFGTDKLEEAMRNLATTYAGQGITTRDLQHVFEQTVNTDLEWFFDQWVRELGIPTVTYNARWAKNEKGTWVLTMHLDQEVYVGDEKLPDRAFNMMVVAYVRSKDGKTRRIKLPMTETSMDYSTEIDIEPVEVTLFDNEETLVRVLKK